MTEPVSDFEVWGPLTSEQEAEVRDWMRSRRGKPASKGLIVAVRLLVTLDHERAEGGRPALDVERLAEAMRLGVLGGHYAAEVAREYAALDAAQEDDRG